MHCHPINRKDITTSIVFQPRETIRYNKKIKCSSSMSFYCVDGKGRQVFNLIGMYKMIELVSLHPTITDYSSLKKKREEKLEY